MGSQEAPELQVCGHKTAPLGRARAKAGTQRRAGHAGTRGGTCVSGEQEGGGRGGGQGAGQQPGEAEAPRPAQSREVLSHAKSPGKTLGEMVA